MKSLRGKPRSIIPLDPTRFYRRKLRGIRPGEIKRLDTPDSQYP